MKRFALSLLLTLTFVLAACAPSQDTAGQSTPPAAAVSPTESALSSVNDTNTSTDLTRSDGQGAITVEVTPLNLGSPADQLEFDITLETHSVDLSMDLAALAALTTDTGLTVQATTWDAPRGGHHVQGTLIFPATQDGQSVLEGAGRLTLTVTNVDAPARVFEWELK